MLLNTIAEKHPNSFVLLLPKTRDEQNRVRDWQVLNTSRHYDKIQKVAKYYRAEGMNNAVICSTCDELVVPPNEKQVITLIPVCRGFAFPCNDRAAGQINNSAYQKK